MTHPNARGKPPRQVLCLHHPGRPGKPGRVCQRQGCGLDELGPSWTTCRKKVRFIQQVIFSAAVACGKVEWGSNLMASHVIYKNDIRFDVVTGSLGCCNIFWQGSMHALRAKTEAPAGQTRRSKKLAKQLHTKSYVSRCSCIIHSLQVLPLNSKAQKCLLSNISILVSLETIQLAPRSMSNCNSGKCPCHAAWQNCNNKRQKFFQALWNEMFCSWTWWIAPENLDLSTGGLETCGKPEKTDNTWETWTHMNVTFLQFVTCIYLDTILFHPERHQTVWHISKREVHLMKRRVASWHPLFQVCLANNLQFVVSWSTNKTSCRSNASPLVMRSG